MVLLAERNTIAKKARRETQAEKPMGSKEHQHKTQA